MYFTGRACALPIFSLPVCLFVWMPPSLSVYLSERLAACVCLNASLPACLFVWTPGCLCLSECLLPCLSVCLKAFSVCMSVCRKVSLFAWMPSCLPVCLSEGLPDLPVCLPECLLPCLSVCLKAFLSACIRLKASLSSCVWNPFCLSLFAGFQNECKHFFLTVCLWLLTYSIIPFDCLSLSCCLFWLLIIFGGICHSFWFILFTGWYRHEYNLHTVIFAWGLHGGVDVMWCGGLFVLDLHWRDCG